MRMNCTWHFNSSDKNNTCISTFESKGNFEQVSTYLIVLCVLNCLLSITTLFGNSTLLITIWKTSSLHSVSNILLASLAASDLAVGLVVQPLFITHLLSGIFCVKLLLNIFSCFLGYASFINITAIASDRLLALQLHLRYHAVVTPFRVSWVIICIWMFSGVSSLLLNLHQTHFKTHFYNVTFITIVSLLVSNFAVYFKIYLIVRRHQRQIRHLQQQQQANNANILSVGRLKKTALNTFLVYILLLGCYTPLAIALIHGGFSPSVYRTTLTLVFLNSSLNPLLYCWRDQDIRTAVKRVFND